MVLNQTLDHLSQPSLTGQVQGREEIGRRGSWSGGAVHVCSIADEEASGGHVQEEYGSVEESEGQSVAVPVPGIGITAMYNLRGGWGEG